MIWKRKKRRTGRRRRRQDVATPSLGESEVQDLVFNKKYESLFIHFMKIVRYINVTALVDKASLNAIFIFKTT